MEADSNETVIGEGWRVRGVRWEGDCACGEGGGEDGGAKGGGGGGGCPEAMKNGPEAGQVGHNP